MAQCFFRIRTVVFSLVVLAAGQVATLDAQILNSSSAPSRSAPSNAGVLQAGGPASAPAGAVEQTGWGIPLPKITMPKLTMPKITMPNVGSVTAPMKSGFGKVTSGTKKAWEGTKEIFSFGQKKTNSPQARNSAPQKTSFWHRLIAKPPEPQGPQTVGEFMRQPRLNP